MESAMYIYAVNRDLEILVVSDDPQSPRGAAVNVKRSRPYRLAWPGRGLG